MMRGATYLGIDLGGTTIKMGLVDGEGNLLQTVEAPTPAKEGYQQVLRVFAEMADNLLRQAARSWDHIGGIGIGVPAFLDLPQRIVVEAINLGWRQAPLGTDLEKLWGKPVVLDNDANAAALGEMWVGAGRGIANLLCLTIGTGVGGGVIINREIYHGANGCAGEIGHLTVRKEGGRLCNCGKRGCLETEASATAIVLNALERVRNMSSGPLKEAYERTGTLTARQIVELARAGEATCRVLLAKAGDVLGKALAEVCYMLNPQRIIIGGGVAYAGPLLFDPLEKAFRDTILPRVGENTDIVPAQLGNQAGMLGAAWLIHCQLKREG